MESYSKMLPTISTLTFMLLVLHLWPVNLFQGKMAQKNDELNLVVE